MGPFQYQIIRPREVFKPRDWFKWPYGFGIWAVHRQQISKRLDNSNDKFGDSEIFGDLPIRSVFALRWRHTERDGVSNHQPHDCFLNPFFRRRSKKTSKLRVTGPWAANSPVTGEFPAQRASNAENISIWWHHHGYWNAFKWLCTWFILSYKPSWKRFSATFWWLSA